VAFVQQRSLEGSVRRSLGGLLLIVRKNAGFLTAIPDWVFDMILGFHATFEAARGGPFVGA